MHFVLYLLIFFSIFLVNLYKVRLLLNSEGKLNKHERVINSLLQEIHFCCHTPSLDSYLHKPVMPVLCISSTAKANIRLQESLCACTEANSCIYLPKDASTESVVWNTSRLLASL